MKKKLSLLLTMLFMLSCLSAGYASENASEDTAENVITLEQAKELAIKNSRNLIKYQINTERAKYQYYQADDQYDEAEHENQNDIYTYNNLEQKRSAKQEELNREDITEEEKAQVIADINDIEKQISDIWNNIDNRSVDLLLVLQRKLTLST